MENDFKVDVSAYYPSSLLGESKTNKKEDAPIQNQNENQNVQQNYSQNAMGGMSALSSLAKNLFGGEDAKNLLSSLSGGSGAGLLSLLKNFSMQKSDTPKTNMLSSLFTKKTTNEENEFASQGKIESFKKVFDDEK